MTSHHVRETTEQQLQLLLVTKVNPQPCVVSAAVSEGAESLQRWHDKAEMALRAAASGAEVAKRQSVEGSDLGSTAWF